jgi:hypothetical protein
MSPGLPVQTHSKQEYILRTLRHMPSCLWYSPSAPYSDTLSLFFPYSKREITNDIDIT